MTGDSLVFAPVSIETPRELAIYGERDSYDDRPRRRIRCVAPKIIQVGPIKPQSGPGPHLIYGSRNRCGDPEFVNWYKKSRKQKKHHRH